MRKWHTQYNIFWMILDNFEGSFIHIFLNGLDNVLILYKLIDLFRADQSAIKNTYSCAISYFTHYSCETFVSLIFFYTHLFANYSSDLPSFMGSLQCFRQKKKKMAAGNGHDIAVAVSPPKCCFDNLFCSSSKTFDWLVCHLSLAHMHNSIGQSSIICSDKLHTRY